MHFKNLFFMIITLLIISVTATLSCKKESISEEARITFIKGTVTIAMFGENASPVTVGQFVLSNQIIETSTNSICEVQFGSQAVARIKPDSSVKIAELQSGTNSSIIDLYINKGTILTHSEKLSNESSLSVSTNSITVGVRGTEFTVEHSDKQSGVYVGEGTVAVKRKYQQITSDDLRKLDTPYGTRIADELDSEIDVDAGSKLEINTQAASEEEDDLEAEIKRIKEKIKNNSSLSDEDMDAIKEKRKGFKKEKMAVAEKQQYLPENDLATMRERRNVSKDDAIPLSLLFEGVDVPVSVKIGNKPILIVKNECTILYSKKSTKPITLDAEGYRPEKVIITPAQLQDKKEYSITVAFTRTDKKQKTHDEKNQKKNGKQKKEGKTKKNKSKSSIDLIGEYSTVENYTIEVQFGTSFADYTQIKVEALYNDIKIHKISFSFTEGKKTSHSKNIQLYFDDPEESSRIIDIPRKNPNAELEYAKFSVSSVEEPGEDTILRVYGIR